jgi:fimbrial isopeptide formation D2 family protein/LPXTG-motif cell wall-anchored protein
LPAGYYLLKDRDTTQSGTSDAYTSFIVEVVGDTMAAVKSDVPTVTKKVMDKDDTEGTTSIFQDSADYHIGDTIPYRIVGTMPANIDAYSTYAYKLTDTMSAGLAYGSDAKIFLDGVDVTGSFVQTVTDNADGTTTVTWEVANLKALGTLTPASEVTVNYTATLDTDAVIGSAGNPNSVNLVYSNNPNTGGEGDTGKTPDDKTVVFTYKVVVNKTDAAGTALTGAEFTLYKQLATGERIEIAAVKSGDGTQFSFNGLDDGTYILRETKTPAGFNTIDDIEFTITAEHEALSDDPRLTSLNGSPTTTGAIEFRSSTTEGSLTAAVVNESGTTLPSTGGMGTRWIYGIGILLVGSAVAYFVIRKRRNGSAD